MKKSQYKGFTLVELLVVIGVIAILVAVVSISFNSARSKTRDSRRVSDINHIQTALEIYYNRNKSYPTVITPGQVLSDGSVTYINPIPSNPSPRTEGGCPDTNYVYASTNSNQSYTINFCLTQATGNIAAGINIATPGSVDPLAYDSDAEALFARFSGTLSSTDKGNINNLIVAGKAHGWWTKMDVFYVFAVGTNSTDARLNWKSSSYTASNVNSVSWVAYRGFTGNGSTSYLNTTYTPSTNGVNYTLNSASGGVYSRTNSNLSVVDMGSSLTIGNDRLELAIRYGNVFYGFVNSGQGTVASSDSSGLFVASRTASNVFFLSRNGSVIANPNTASSSLASLPVYICGGNLGGLTAPSTRQYAAAFMGGGLTPTESADLSTDLNAYMTAVGANVY